MITGMHAVIYTRDAEADRAFFRDVLGFSSVDAGDGWLIFAIPPAELARIRHDGEKLRDGCGKKRAIHVANRCPNKLHRVSALRHSRHDR